MLGVRLSAERLGVELMEARALAERAMLDGKIHSASDEQACLEAGVDFVLVGRGAILHHDFPERVRNDPEFEMVQTPVTPNYLHTESLGDAFVEYMSGWTGFVAPTA